MAITVSNPKIVISKATLVQAIELGKKIKKHISTAEGQKLLRILYLLINDVVAQMKSKKVRPTQAKVLDAVLPTILRIEDELGWDVPHLSEDVEDHFLVWMTGRAVDHVLTGSLHPSRV